MLLGKLLRRRSRENANESAAPWMKRTGQRIRTKTAKLFNRKNSAKDLSLPTSPYFGNKLTNWYRALGTVTGTHKLAITSLHTIPPKTSSQDGNEQYEDFAPAFATVETRDKGSSSEENQEKWQPEMADEKKDADEQNAVTPIDENLSSSTSNHYVQEIKSSSSISQTWSKGSYKPENDCCTNQSKLGVKPLLRVPTQNKSLLQEYRCCSKENGLSKKVNFSRHSSLYFHKVIRVTDSQDMDCAALDPHCVGEIDLDVVARDELLTPTPLPLVVIDEKILNTQEASLALSRWFHSSVCNQKPFNYLKKWT